VSKDRRRNGRKFSRSEYRKHKKRAARRRDAWSKTGDGAGARDPTTPKRHRRRPVKPEHIKPVQIEPQERDTDEPEAEP
jgi:hypothetical protein